MDYTGPGQWNLGGAIIWGRIEVVCGIYVLFNGRAIVYIGQSVNVQSRITVHRFPWDYAIVLPCPIEQLDTLESMLISLLMPPHNKRDKPKCIHRIMRLWECEDNPRRIPYNEWNQLFNRTYESWKKINGTG